MCLNRILGFLELWQCHSCWGWFFSFVAFVKSKLGASVTSFDQKTHLACVIIYEHLYLGTATPTSMDSMKSQSLISLECWKQLNNSKIQILHSKKCFQGWLMLILSAQKVDAGVDTYPWGSNTPSPWSAQLIRASSSVTSVCSSLELHGNKKNHFKKRTRWFFSAESTVLILKTSFSSKLCWKKHYDSGVIPWNTMKIFVKVCCYPYITDPQLWPQLWCRFLGPWLVHQ